MTHNFDDDICNQSNNEHFQSVLGKALENPSRRRLIQGGFGLAALSTMAMLPGCAGISAAGRAKSASLGFGSIDKSVLDSVILPPGYSYKVLHAGGDPLNRSATAYSNQGTETDDWSARIGDQHDGMDIYYVDAAGKYSDKDTGRAVLTVNHESSAEAHFLHPKGQTSNGVSGRKFDQFGRWDLGARPELEVLKEINLHGVSVVELSKTASGWSYKLDSPLNRRVTPQTPARITGPAAHMADIRAMMSTRFDPSGATSRGTLNNCGHGKTPWGTFLACEENWAMYFQIPVGANAGDAKTVASRRRYGVSSAALTSANKTERSQGWHTVSTSDNRFTRWNIATAGNSAAEDFRNEPNTFGYNFEIDPLAPNSVPAKRVSMGRFAHEAAVCSLPKVALRWPFTWAAIPVTSTSTNLSRMPIGMPKTLVAAWRLVTSICQKASCTLPNSMLMAKASGLSCRSLTRVSLTSRLTALQTRLTCSSTRVTRLMRWVPHRWIALSGVQSTTKMAKSISR